jgi:hypothetical protein
MKRLTMLAVALLGVVPLASAASVKHPAFSHYVACGLSSEAKPAHSCQAGWKKGAFFRSNKGDVFYTVCVKFPTKKQLCAPQQEAEQGRLYVNKITSNIPGEHRVTWFVKGKQVGVYSFVVTERSQKRSSRK